MKRVIWTAEQVEEWRVRHGLRVWQMGEILDACPSTLAKWRREGWTGERGATTLQMALAYEQNAPTPEEVKAKRINKRRRVDTLIPAPCVREWKRVNGYTFIQAERALDVPAMTIHRWCQNGIKSKAHAQRLMPVFERFIQAWRAVPFANQSGE